MKVRVVNEVTVGNPTVGQHYLLAKSVEGDWQVCVLTITSLTAEPRFSVRTYPPTPHTFRRLLIDLHSEHVGEILLPIGYLSEMDHLSQDSVVLNLLEVDLSGITTPMVVSQDFADIIAKQ